jgi:hypothetical protein
MGPADTHQCWAVLDFYEESPVLVIKNNSEWFQFHQKLETQVWFGS